MMPLYVGAQSARQTIPLNNEWQTILEDSLSTISLQSQPDKNWRKVNVPHNWDAYHGYRRLRHGNLHGAAWYQKTFTVQQSKNNKRFFLFFEGVGSYATVYLNGKKAGEHAGGRTTFTLDVTDHIKTDGSNNDLRVYANHPANIRDLPWVCGGCSDERGFSEGSQPLGIFRPVHLVITADTRIEPFGVHAWSAVNEDHALLHINTTIKNYSSRGRTVEVVSQLVNREGKVAHSITSKQTIKPHDSIVIAQHNNRINNPKLWSPEQPYLYKIVTVIKEKNKVLDKTETDVGFRTISWKNPSKRFYINGKPVFINGVAEYEHLPGQSHAFHQEQIIARMKWLKAAGFNALRDAHQPHNLLYGKLCNEMGILWWTQLTAHIWFDSPAFRQNFLRLLKQWVIERRNDPSVVLWGLQNESHLPEDFARQCTELIRKLDPTASSERLVTTCNGGAGTDWDVPQNWTGTYGGDPHTYDRDLIKQVLVGEYGAWRTLDLHTEGGFQQNSHYSEDRMTQLMELKVRLAESVKDSVAGHFFWLLTSHDNPGRVQGGEGQREMDRIGPVNYKGLLTPWEEPLDVFYMFRSNYAPKETEPMVYIASHTWPSRWLAAGRKDSIMVYSNCDEVELFNDINGLSLGKKQRNGIGTHFIWNDALIQYNVLYAVGYVNGKPVARDTMVLHHLPQSPNFRQLYSRETSITKPEQGYHYIYRMNCGGPEYKDEYGNAWLPDRAVLPGQSAEQPFLYSCSWTNDFSEMPPYFVSQRRTFVPIKGTRDWSLFQTFRYGKDKLQFVFPLPKGEYRIELYFTEPWIGIGGGIDGKGMRLFDVAINGQTVIDDLDIWKEAGANTALKKVVPVSFEGGNLVIAFPESRAGQAIISAIAIASRQKITAAASVPLLVKNVQGLSFADSRMPSDNISVTPPTSDKASGKNVVLSTWLDIGSRQYSDTTFSFYSLPPQLFGADYLQMEYKASGSVSFVTTAAADLFIGVRDKTIPSWLKGFEHTGTEVVTDENQGTSYTVYRKRYEAGSEISLPVEARYIIMLQPVNHMQPAYDLKPVTPYRTDVAILSSGMEKKNIAGRDCAVALSEDEVFVEWPVHTGVADRYSVTVKYYYEGTDTLPATLQWIDVNETVLHEETIPVSYTRPGKWNQYTVNTSSMINAGHYRVRLTIRKAKGLALSGIDVQ